jgi:ribokinase
MEPMKKRIVVVGSINLDLVARVERMPCLGETISGQDLQTFCGGKGANQAVAAARLGVPVTLIAKLGDDHFGGHLRANLAEAGVDSTYVESVAGPSGTALITATPNGENSIIVIPGANGKLHCDDLERCKDELRNAAIILVQLESPLRIVEHLASLAKSFDVPLMLDPAPAQPLEERVLCAVTWFTPNESETRTFLGDARLQVDSISAPKVAERILRMGVRNVILKLGAKGVYMAGKDVTPLYVPGFQVDAVDTTAAGDTFNGAFASGLAIRKMTPQNAAEFACAAAAISVTRHGAQTSMPKLAEVEEFLRQRSRDIR